MTENIIYALFYIFEGITCYVFAENVCQRRSVTGARNYRLPVVFILGCSLSYAVSLFDMPPLNILAFIITTFIILFFCYQTKPLSAGFLTAMLTAFMIVSEMIVVLVFTSAFGTHVSAWQTDTFILTIEACLSKLL